MWLIFRRLGLRGMLDVTASLAMLAASAVVLTRSSGLRVVPVAQPVSVPSAPVSLDDTPALGSAGAQVVMLMYSDFACPYLPAFRP